MYPPCDSEVIKKNCLKQKQRLKQSLLEQELLKKLDKRKSASKDIYIVKKDTHISWYLDSQRQQDALEKMLLHYRLYNFNLELKDFIKSISRYEPDYYLIKITTDFTGKIITKNCESHR